MRGRWCFLVAVLAAAGAVFLVGCNNESPGRQEEVNSRTRTLALPKLAGGDECPVPSERRVSADFGPALGKGPVYPVGIARGLLQFIYPPVESQSWYPSEWGGQKVLWIVDPKYQGQILIRGGRIDAPGRLGFGKRSQPEWAMNFRPGGSDGVRRQFPSFTRLKAPGCYAYQIDGDGFRRIVVFQAAVFS